jgi:fatty acid desaturase
MRGQTTTYRTVNSAVPFISKEKAAAGQWIPRRNSGAFPIPGRLNLLLTAAQVTAAFTILTAASHTPGIYLQVSLAIVFAFIMQMGFCLVHEAVHRKLHPNAKFNLGLGIFIFSLFPGSFHFFEVAHLIHHRRNRSNDELEDYVLPGENPWVKRIMYYLLISGLFWLLLPLSSIVVALIPRKRIRLPRPEDEAGAFRKFAQFLNEVRPNRVRRDLLVAAVVWGLAFPLLHLRLSSVAICYAAFGFSWASQQYIYHVRTPRHAVLGAHDLKLWRPLRLLYLNFNYHLTHHLAVWIPWTHIPATAAQQPSQGYLKTYIGLWNPPELLEEAWPAQYQKSGPLPLQLEREPTLEADNE